MHNALQYFNVHSMFFQCTFTIYSINIQCLAIYSMFALMILTLWLFDSHTPNLELLSHLKRRLDVLFHLYILICEYWKRNGKQSSKSPNLRKRILLSMISSIFCSLFGFTRNFVSLFCVRPFPGQKEHKIQVPDSLFKSHLNWFCTTL